MQDDVFYAKSSLKGQNKTRVKSRHIFINEDLSENNHRLFKAVHEYVHGNKLHRAWASNCRMVIKTSGDVIHAVYNLGELKNLVKEDD